MAIGGPRLLSGAEALARPSSLIVAVGGSSLRATTLISVGWLPHVCYALHTDN